MDLSRGSRMYIHEIEKTQTTFRFITQFREATVVYYVNFGTATSVAAISQPLEPLDHSYINDASALDGLLGEN